MRQDDFAGYSQNVYESKCSQRFLVWQRVVGWISEAMGQLRQAKDLPASKIGYRLMTAALFKTKPRKSCANEDQIFDHMPFGSDQRLTRNLSLNV